MFNIQAKPKGENQNVLWFYAWFQMTVRNMDQSILLEQLKRQIEPCCCEFSYTSCLPCYITSCLASFISMSLLHLTHQNIKEDFMALRSSSRITMERRSRFCIGQIKKQHKNMKDRNQQQRYPLMWDMNFEMSGTHWLSCNRINLTPAAPNKIPQMRNKSSAGNLRR